MNISTRPIGTWPGVETPSYQRKRSPFRTSWPVAMNHLDRELRYLGTTELVLEIDYRAFDLRLDGMPRANARSQGPRIVVYAKTRRGDLRIPCDTFKDHEANLYAIALTLEKLRAIDRYGVTLAGEQYRGFTAIPASTSVTTKVNAAWAILERESEMDLLDGHRDREALDVYYRNAAQNAHPDVGGSDERMSAVNRARDTILADLT